jgi:hypothetical protein
MAKTIWKYSISYNCSIVMPKGAKILDVQEQHGEVCLWVLVNPMADTENRNFVAYRTGFPLDEEYGTYIGTCLLSGGDLVLHVFETTGKQL